MRRFAGNLELAHRLRDLFGHERVTHSPLTTLVYGRDLRTVSSMRLAAGETLPRPDFIVWPETVDEVSRLMRMATEWRVPVIPYGGGTNRRAAPIADQGGIVCDMKRMRRVLHVDEESMIVSAQAGLTVRELEWALERLGYTLGLRGAGHDSSTVGGSVSARESGTTASRYGTMADKVVSLQAVLPNGSIVKTRAAPRSATGPDLDHLLIGTEGTLGIITRAKLRFRAIPGSRRFLSYALRSVDDGIEVLRLIARGALRPAAARLSDAAETAAMFAGNEGLGETGPLLCLVFEGSDARTQVECEIAASHAERCGGRSVGQEPARRWYDRSFAEHHRLAPAFAERGAFAEMITLSAFWSVLPELYTAAVRAASQHARVSAYVADPEPNGASLTLLVEGAGGTAAKPESYRRICREVSEVAARLGAAMAGPCDQGVLEAWYGADQAGAADVLRKLKQRLDPHNILNPGKLLASAG